MRQILVLLFWTVLAFAAGARAQDTKNAAPEPTIASSVDQVISLIEKEVLDAAEAMPEAKFNFSPESLKIPGGWRDSSQTRPAWYRVTAFNLDGLASVPTVPKM
jgi:hypothetical protein